MNSSNLSRSRMTLTSVSELVAEDGETVDSYEATGVP
jgi:hypothetical protein